MHFRTVRGWCLGLLLTVSATRASAAEPPSQGVVLAAEPRTFAEAKALPPKLTESAACDLGLGKTPDLIVSQTVDVTQALPDFCRPAEAVITQKLSLPDGSHVERRFRVVDDAPGTQLPPPPPRPRIRVRCDARRLELSVEGVPESPSLTLEPIGIGVTSGSVKFRVSRDSEARFLPLLARDDAGARRALEEWDFLVGKGVPSRMYVRDANLPEADSVAGLAVALERARNRATLAAGEDVEQYSPRDVLAPDLEGDRPPLKTGAPETIGEVQPSESDSDLFWRQGRLCVVQQDTGKRMRCYDPMARRWGKAVPVDRGDGSLRMGRCGVPLGTRNVRPPGGFPPELRLSSRAVLFWTGGVHGAQVMEVPDGDGPPRLRAPEAEELKKAMLASTGSRLFGEGRFILDEDRKQFCSVRKPLGCWSLRWGGQEDEGANQLSEARVSPDGRWIAYLRDAPPSKVDSDERTLSLVVRSLELGPYVAPRVLASTEAPLARTDVVMPKPVWDGPALKWDDNDRLDRARISCDLGQDPRIPFEMETQRIVSPYDPLSPADNCHGGWVKLRQELTAPGNLKFVRYATAIAGDSRSLEGEVEGDVKMRCQPGRMSLWVDGVPDFPALTLTANMGAFGAVRWALAQETEARLQALLARDDASAREALEAFARLVKWNEDSREVSYGKTPNEDGRISRMGCVSTALEAIAARRALADGVHPELHGSLKTDGACAERYGMRALQQRLHAATLPLPLRVGEMKGRAEVIGRVESVPSIPPERGPQVYWRDGTLCQVQPDGAQVRCYDPAARKWGPLVNKQDRPFPREELLQKSEYHPGACYPMGGRSVPVSEQLRDVLPLSPRASLFADTSPGELAPEFKVLEVPGDAGPVRTRAPTAEELVLAARAGGGSALLEGRFLLHAPKNERSPWLCTAVRPWRCWSLDLESEAYAVFAAMASPDGRWLSYVRVARQKPYIEELMLLPLPPIP
ncbi:hypothetical protein D7X55_35010 [Corallococcus sp. AB049A]|uniref:PD40 domain-containing protein n=1 Tax=Corallococcus sp. AB049A TaxID=2316721 RepID=UPI000EDFC33B|nr:PD40 domain-containing protein [Corallococcus sp. AB049A]RKI51056.1 hypothetical protein D7X55_35010 [Corallococcus sp. AB049A]